MRRVRDRLAAPAGSARVRRRIAVVVVALAAVAGTITVAGQSGTPSGELSGTQGSGRGSLISSRSLAMVSREQISRSATEFGFVTARVDDDVEVFGLRYRTIDAVGAPTEASGVVALPRTARADLRTVVYLHGTTVQKTAVGSVEAVYSERMWSALIAAAGFAAVAPDYLGLGTSPGTHPYLHAATEASASVDMLRAARTFMQSRQRTLDPRVLVTGMSQGGHAAMALAKALDEGADPQLSLAAAAPIAGPYDMRGVMIPGLLNGDVLPKAGTMYIAYWTVAMNRLHPLYSAPAEAFRAPYDQIVDGLFDGSHSWSDVMARLPDTPASLFTPAYVARLASPDGALLAATEASDGVCDWHPTAPVRLYAGSADHDVPIADSSHCRQALLDHGADVPVVDLGAIDHTTSFQRGLPLVVDWFRTLS
jgi:hypothetical protein